MTENQDQDQQASNGAQRVLYVTDYDLHYGVNSDGGAWRPGQKRRVKPPPFLRFYIGGPKGDDRAFAETAMIVAERFGEEVWALAWAVFWKVAEIATRQDEKHRGYVLGKGNSPISAKMLRYATHFTQEQIDKGLAALTDPAVNWLQWRDAAELQNGFGESTARRLQEGEAQGEASEYARKKKGEAQGEGETNTPPKQPAAEDASLIPLPPQTLASPEATPPEQPAAAAKPQEAGKPFHAIIWADSAHKALGAGRGEPKQLQRDLSDLKTVAEAILAGKCGQNVKPIAEHWMARAWEIGHDEKIRAKVGYFLAAFRSEYPALVGADDG